MFEQFFFEIYKLKVHPIFHVSLLKLVTHDASKLSREHNSKPPPDLIDNELEFEVEAMFKLRLFKGAGAGVLGQVERIPPNRGILGE